MNMFTAPSLAGELVLLAEDESRVPSNAEEMLREAGAFVLLAQAAHQAILIVSQHDLTAAVLDEDLGQEALERICTCLELHAIPFAFITGSEVGSGWCWGHAAVVRRPVSADVLVGVGRQLCDRR